MKLPSHLPKWVRDAVEAKPSLGNYPNFIRALRSKKTILVWENLRERTAEQRRRSGKSDAELLFWVAFGIELALPRADELRRGRKSLTPKQRRKLANEIADAALALKTRIERLLQRDRDELSSAPFSRAFHLAARDALIGEFRGFVSYDEDLVTLCRVGDLFCDVASFPKFFDAIAEGAASWGVESQIVTRPGRPNARRLYFIRSMSDLFVSRFGQPLRAQTSCLASVFFDMSGLRYNSDITKRAPVRLARKPSQRRVSRN